MTNDAPRGRRDFLRSLAGGLVQGVGEVAKAREAVVLPLLGVVAVAGNDDPMADASHAPAVPGDAARATRLAGPDDVAAAAEELGLSPRLDTIRALGRTSTRLTPARAGSRAAAAWMPENRLLMLDLAGIAIGEGILSCGIEGGAARIEYDASGRLGGGDPLEASGEFVLPRFWADPVQAAGLEPGEHDAWERLRTRLAEAQGVEPPGETPFGLIRVGGYPDEKVGDMPLTCELRARGHDTSATGALLHPAAKQCKAAAGRWRMLLQLPVGEGRRCFVWTAGDQLADYRSSELQGFVR